MNKITKAAFKWIASTTIIMGLMVQPSQAGDRYYKKNHHYSQYQDHYHTPYCRHGNRHRLRYNHYDGYPKQRYYNSYNEPHYGHRYYHKPRRLYRHRYKRNRYRQGHRHGYQSGGHYYRGKGGNITIRF